MRLPGTEVWSEEYVEAALAFADNLRVATVTIASASAEWNLPGGPIVASPWDPTDLIYELGEAAALAFATGRLREGLRIAVILSRSYELPPRLTLMQVIFAATLGTIVGTAEVELFGDEVTIMLKGRRDFLKIDLTDHALVDRYRLAELIIPAAFASPGFLDEIHGLQIERFARRTQANSLDGFARLSPLVRLARDWKQGRQIDQSLLAGRLLEYEGHIEALRTDKRAWDLMEFGGALIDWPLLGMLVGVHRAIETPSETDLVTGPSTRFLHDLARAIVAEPLTSEA